MQGAFPTMVTQPERGELGGPPMVIQQFARYPSSMEAGLQSASSIGSAHSQLAVSKSPPLHRKATPRSVQASPTAPRPALPPGPPARSGPSMSPPVFDPLRQRQMRDGVDQAGSRSLPSRDITDENIDDAYIMFIFYCNPNVPQSADSTELRKTFRCPPRSDGKSFSVFTLWELIKKLDSKELKTWIQLAIELGVEPPDMEKKQSTQKVQQYAVRLKRWMRAMHVDAFFEYCLGHPHPYYTQLPASNAVVSDSRDGVPLEEDLALRALVPQWKPKRGRKRTEEKDSASDRGVKRPQLDTSVGVFHAGSFAAHSATFPQSAIPFSAFPEDVESNDPWMAASSFTADNVAPGAPSVHQGQDLRWKGLEREASPAGYPQSAILPRGHHPSDALLSSEPRSAVTPSSGEKTRAKRRHGPAVSSAWPNNTTSSTGKMRGRPPNRGTVSGPFSSFPVNPNRSDPSHLHSTGVRPSPTIVLEQDSTGPYHQTPTPVHVGGRPNKLQLQVPQHSGAPVRLATPPTLLLNGVSNPQASDGNHKNGRVVQQPDATGGTSVANTSSNINRSGIPNAVVTSDDVTRILTGELLRATLTGRQIPLSTEEAGALASVVVTNLTILYDKLPFNAAALTSALHLGLGPHFGYPGVTDSTISVHIEPRTAPSGDPGLTSDGRFATSVYKVSLEYKHASRLSTRVCFDNIYIGNASSNVSTMATNTFEDVPRQSDDMENSVAELDSLTDAEFEVDNADGSVSETTWKQRYLKLRAQMQKRERSLSQYKRKILESVMADI
ncbi:ARS binding protein 2-domain-containing protein [Aspergillus egyptiacus]|nr:ARS binding protein 2-domain-containing protein [Aspergillus egyptiacus]